MLSKLSTGLLIIFQFFHLIDYLMFTIRQRKKSDFFHKTMYLKWLFSRKNKCLFCISEKKGIVLRKFFMDNEKTL